MHDTIAPQRGADHQSIAEDFRYLAYPDHLLVLLLDAHGQCEFVSPTWIQFTGRSVAQGVAGEWLERVHADDREAFAAGLQQSQREMRPVRQLFRYLRQDGSYRWFVNHGCPRIAPDGTYIGQIGMFFDVHSLQTGQAETAQSAQKIIEILRETRLIAVVLDTSGRVQFANAVLCGLLQYRGVDLIDSKFFQRFLSESQSGLLHALYTGGQQSPDFPVTFETELCTRANTARHVVWHAIVLRDLEGNISSTVLIGDDVSALRESEKQLALSAQIFAATDQAMMITTLDGTIVAVNPAFSQLTGYEASESLGQTPHILCSGRQDRAFYNKMWAQLAATGHWSGDLWDKHKDGSVHPVVLSVSALRDNHGHATHYAAIFHDIAERKNFEDRLDRLAHFDTLTEIPNRCLLLDRLEQAAKRAVRQETRLGLLYLDLDGFKGINDTRGHATGDELLKKVAQRLTLSVRAVDTVARLGGDEFVVLIPDLVDVVALRRVCEKVCDALRENYQLGAETLQCASSIGVSVFPDDTADTHELVKLADTAMYQAKRAGGGRFKFFSDPVAAGLTGGQKPMQSTAV